MPSSTSRRTRCSRASRADSFIIGAILALSGRGCILERVTGLDASFLYNETPTLHMHTLKYTVLDVSTVPGGYDFERFQHELERRLHLLPGFRRRIVEVPGRLHHPVWIEDPDFDLAYHVRRIGVPPPGGREEMDEVIADIASWPLDRSRPLWEIWMLEGLEGGR